MSPSLPNALHHLIAALDSRGYALVHGDADAVGDEAGPVLLELAEEMPGGQVWFVPFNREWFIGIAFGGTLWDARDVMLVMDGGEPLAHAGLAPLDEQVEITLRALDRLHRDQIAGSRAAARLIPDPGDPSLGPAGNDPCWCGSGKKLKRCHASTAS